MSVYNRAWLYTGLSLPVFMTAPIWLFAAVERWGAAAAVSALIFYLAYMAGLVWGFRCPECGGSVYKISKRLLAVYSPCPFRWCRCCGFDLASRKPA